MGNINSIEYPLRSCHNAQILNNQRSLQIGSTIHGATTRPSEVLCPARTAAATERYAAPTP